MGIKRLIINFVSPIFFSAGSIFFGINLLLILLILLVLKLFLKKKFIFYFNRGIYIGISWAILQIFLSTIFCARYTREARKVIITLAKEPELEAAMIVITEGTMKAASEHRLITNARTKYVAQELGKKD